MNLDELIMRLTHIRSAGVSGDTEVLINHARSPYEPEVDEVGSVELEVYKQLKNELSENVNKAINDLNNTYKNLRQMIKDTKNKANEEMSSKYNEAIENFKNNVNKYNDILAENGCGLSLSDEIPNELLSHKYKNFS